MWRDQVSVEIRHGARQNGTELGKGFLELNDAELEAVIGGKEVLKALAPNDNFTRDTLSLTAHTDEKSRPKTKVWQGSE